MTLYNFKKIKGKRVIVWNPGRLRGIVKAKDRIGDVVKDAKSFLKKKKKIRILEVGCGYGRALLDLRKIFGDKVEVYGINSEKRWNLNLIKKFALAHKIFSIKELKKNLPKLYILDAGKKLPFKSNYFDLIYSQSCVQYIADKVLFLEEVNRMLAKDGIARIDFQPIGNKHIGHYKYRIEIWEGCKEINAMKYFGKFKNIQVKKSKERPEGYLIMKKGKNFKLNLEIIASFNMHHICKTWWGRKTIYKLKK